MAEENRPFIGYRSAGRRPESQQDRRAAADAPLSALRGMVSGVLGAPGDIESLIRMLPGLSERTVLPTSEDIEKRLPMRELNQTPTGRAFTTAGQLGGGFYTGPGSPLRAVAALPSAVSRAGRDFAMAAGQPAVNVVKPKGGNWLAGSVERAVEPMRRSISPTLRQDMQAMGLRVPEEELSGVESMNRWLDQKLAKYIRNDMATPEDPLRALADRGVTHIPEGLESLERVTEWIPETLESRRKAAGFPAGGMSQTPYGQGWEQLADEAIHNMPARMRVNPDSGGGSMIALQTEKDNPWLMKVPPDTMTYGAYPVEVRSELGFEHLVDELRNAINPESGLPANLRLKYQDLEKVTVPQAVERVAKINDWRAAQKVEADMARAMNPATQVVKEYPDQGYKWVELRQPKETGKKVSVERPEMDLPPGFDERQARDAAMDMAADEGLDEGTQAFDDFVRNMMTDFNRKKTVDIDESYKALEDALKYEGETMGHCVGGYCPDVVEGRSKIYSLRDKKGQPHVTIEVRPGRKLTEKDMPDDVREMLSEQYGDASREEFEAAVQAYLKQQAVPDEIVQIKGKGNKAPKEDYLPAVQDFVRSGNWGRIGDLQNTGLVQLPDKRLITKEQFDEGVQRLTGEGGGPGSEWFMNVMRGDPSWWEESKGAFEGYARGGLVDDANSPTGDFDPARIDAMVSDLYAMNTV